MSNEGKPQEENEEKEAEKVEASEPPSVGSTPGLGCTSLTSSLRTGGSRSEQPTYSSHSISVSSMGIGYSTAPHSGVQQIKNNTIRTNTDTSCGDSSSVETNPQKDVASSVKQSTLSSKSEEDNVGGQGQLKGQVQGQTKQKVKSKRTSEKDTEDEIQRLRKILEKEQQKYQQKDVPRIQCKRPQRQEVKFKGHGERSNVQEELNSKNQVLDTEEKISEMFNERSKGQVERSKSQEGRSTTEKKVSERQKETLICEVMSRSDSVTKLPDQTVTGIQDVPDEKGATTENPDKTENQSMGAQSQDMENNIQVQETLQEQQDGEVKRKQTVVEGKMKQTIDQAQPLPVDAFKMPLSASTESMNFIKSLWSPMMRESNENTKISDTISHRDRAADNENSAPSNKPSSITSKCKSFEVGSAPDSIIHKHRASSPNLSDSDSSLEECEFENDLILGGKRNVQALANPLTLSMRDTSRSTCSSISVTIEAPKDTKLEFHVNLKTKMDPDKQVERRRHENRNNGALNGHAHSQEDHHKVGHPYNVITVSNNSHDEYGGIFTRRKPKSAVYSSISINPRPITAQPEELFGDGMQASNLTENENRETDTTTRFFEDAGTLNPSNSLQHCTEKIQTNPEIEADFLSSQQQMWQTHNPNQTNISEVTNRIDQSETLIQEQREDLNQSDATYEQELQQIQKTDITQPQNIESPSEELPQPVDSIEEQDSVCGMTGLKDLAESYGFIIKDVTPDGNCMFNAIVDQLRIHGNFDFNPQTLRKAAVSYLRENPFNKDGTHMEAFLCRETWEMYLARMGRETVWGDHMALQACVEVTGYRIDVVKSPTNIAKIEPVSTEAEKYDTLYLGYISESHFISLRQKDWEDTWHIRAKARKMKKDFPNVLRIMKKQQLRAKAKLKSLMDDIQILMNLKEKFEKLQMDQDGMSADKNTEEENPTATVDSDKQEMKSAAEMDSGNEEDEQGYEEELKQVENWLSFDKGLYVRSTAKVIYGREKLRKKEKPVTLEFNRNKQGIDGKSNLPLPHVRTIMVNIIRPTYLSNIPKDVFSMEFISEPGEVIKTQPVGAILDEMSYTFKDFRGDVTGQPVKIYPSFIGVNEGVMVYEQDNANKKMKDLITYSTLCRPGYVYLRPVTKAYWQQLHRLHWLEDSEPFVTHVNLQGNIHDFAKSFSGYKCVAWPSCAVEWAMRDRTIAWPSTDLIEEIMKTDCLVISKSHPRCLLHKIEWMYAFPSAEEILSRKCLTVDQRYCFSVFKVLVDFHTRQFSLKLRTTHLKTVLFYVCEEIPTVCWSENVAGCVFYLLDKLLLYINVKDLPNYFIKDNNMIDHFTDNALENLKLKIESIRMFPVISMIFLTEENGIFLTFVANKTLEDVEQYRKDTDIKRCVKQVLSPVVMKLAKYFFQWGYNIRGCQAVQRAYQEMFLHLEGIDKVPNFEEFVLDRLNDEKEYMKYLMAFQLDQIMNTNLLKVMGKSNTVSTLGDLIGTEAAGIRSSLPVPKNIAGKTISEVRYIDDLAGQHYHQGQFQESAQLVCSAIRLARSCKENVIDVSDIENPKTKEDIQCQNYRLMESFYSTIKTCFYHLYLCYTMIGQLHLFQEYIEEYEEACDKTGDHKHYNTVAIIWWNLGREDKYYEVKKKSNTLSFMDYGEDDLD